MMERTPSREKPQAGDIRPVTPADYGRISEIICRCLSEVNIRDYGKDHIDQMLPTFAADNLGQWFAGAHPVCLQQDGEIVATGTIRGGEIQTVFVDPSRHGMGYGKLLMKHLEDVAKSRGVTEVILRSSRTSKAFYESLGYRSKGDTYGAVGGQMILMAKKVEELT